MRDLIVSLVILGLMPACFKRPFVGLVVFSWLAYMRVQDLAWGFARFQRWSFYVAIIMLAGFFVSKERRRFFLPDPRTYLLIFFRRDRGDQSPVERRTHRPRVHVLRRVREDHRHRALHDRRRDESQSTTRDGLGDRALDGLLRDQVGHLGDRQPGSRLDHSWSRRDALRQQRLLPRAGDGGSDVVPPGLDRAQSPRSGRRSSSPCR